MTHPVRIAMIGVTLAACGVFTVKVDHAGEATIGEYATSVDGRNTNQRHNATLCLLKLRGKVIPPGGVLSFNRTVGSWSRDKGYRRAPVSYDGILIDSWGGGVCQTSTTLYNAALKAGLDVVERHPHHYAPSYIVPGRDAAVAYPHIDLQIHNPYREPVTLKGEVSRDLIRIWFVSAAKPNPSYLSTTVLDRRKPFDLNVGHGLHGRVVNPGKTGFTVATYLARGGSRMLLSQDSYPVINRVTEWRSGR